MMADSSLYLVMFSHIATICLILLGLYAIVVHRNLIRVVLGLGLLDAGANLFVITIGYRDQGVAPILTAQNTVPNLMVDPIPQALVLTAIVIGVGVQALALALAVKTYQTHGTLDMVELSEKLSAESGVKMIDGSPAWTTHGEPPSRPLTEHNA